LDIVTVDFTFVPMSAEIEQGACTKYGGGPVRPSIPKAGGAAGGRLPFV
jgi:hypothetical protein